MALSDISQGHTHGGVMQGHSARQPAVTKRGKGNSKRTGTLRDGWQPRRKARYAPALSHAKFSFAGITPGTATKWVPILGFWGVGAAAGLSLYLSDVPKFKNDILLKIPLVRNYFEDKTPASDKPF